MNEVIIIKIPKKGNLFIVQTQDQRTCTDQICLLKSIIEQISEMNKAVLALFMDSEKTFHSVNRKKSVENPGRIWYIQ